MLDRLGGNILLAKKAHGVRMRRLVLVSLALVAMPVLAEPKSPPTASISTLPRSQQAAISAAVDKWDHQFKWMAHSDSGSSIGGASFEILSLGPLDEKDLVVTDQSGCSPTGNCSMLFLRPFRGGYRVVLDGIGQTYEVRRTQRHGFRDVQLRMHGSATESTVKTYKFNGTRYLRSGCQDLNFEILDKQGNVQELEKPQVTPCH